MAEIIDGNKIAEEMLLDLKNKIGCLKELSLLPLRLAVIMVGQNPASLSYIKKKQEAGEKIGLSVEVKNLPEDISQAELQKIIKDLNDEAGIFGIVVQLPLPEHLDRQEVLNTVRPGLDVDCLTSENQQKLIRGEESLYKPPAAAAILHILESCQMDLATKDILIVGSGDLVGKPLASMLLHQGINFQLANRYTENLEELTKRADVVITGVGLPGLITGKMIKEGAIVIDAGSAASEGGELSGDVELGSVKAKASLIAPVPGGVGPVTVAMLLGNVVKSAQVFRAFDI